MFLEINLCSGAGAACFHVPWGVNVIPFGGANANGSGVSGSLDGVDIFSLLVSNLVDVVSTTGADAKCTNGRSCVHVSPQELIEICVTSSASKHVFISDQVVVTYKHSFMEKALKLGNVDYDNLHDEDFNVIVITNEML